MNTAREGGTYLLRMRIFNGISGQRETGEDVDFFDAVNDDAAIKKAREFEANVGGRSIYRYKIGNLYRVEVLKEINTGA